MSRFPTRAVENVIRSAIRGKLAAYNPEPSDKPFQVRLLGKDRMALYTFIQSLNTTFGTSIYEPVAKEIARHHFDRVELQARAPNEMSVGMRGKVDEIVRRLEAASANPSRIDHNSDLRSAIGAETEKVAVRLSKIDVLLQRGNNLYLVDIKTAKPNISGFQKYKRTLLEWMGAYLELNPSLEVYPMIAIPYNPYAPKPYSRWTLRGMLDLDHELKVAEEFWDFLGGSGSFEEVLKCFERVGMQLRPEIDAYFARFQGQDG
ncbi:MAG: TdeIII family type II restriction endonuclease [Chloroflexi bacterium]|nr:TdeIII family type II restriction endonuclease [Chloroflexota bacterium]MYA93840.1 TdeIII family type II restriction endonuclease [Chloroflexota bacterium]